jgi:hypothetical protein
MQARYLAVPMALAALAACSTDSTTGPSRLAPRTTPAMNHSGTSGVLERIQGTNPTCAGVLAGKGITFTGEIKFEGADLASGKSLTEDGLTITLLDVSNNSFDWTASAPRVVAVLVKAGSTAHNFYYYNPAADHDNDLATAFTQGISHISFCYGETPLKPRGQISVEKTANTAYDRSWTWTPEKTANPAAVTLPNGGSVDVEFKVKVSAVSQASNFVVSGEITVQNTGDANSSVRVDNVADLLDGNALTVSCTGGLPQTLAHNASFKCTYTTLLGSATPTRTGTNVVTVTGVDLLNDNDLSAEDQVAYDFGQASVTHHDKCVAVTDVLNGTPDLLTGIPAVLCGDDAALADGFEEYTYTRTIGPIAATACGANRVCNVVTLTPQDSETAPVSDEACVVITVPCFGCTPGYWKNNNVNAAGTGWKNVDPAFLFATTLNSTSPSAFGDVFGSFTAIGNTGMRAALDFGGGNTLTGAVQNLMRAATAALLNASWSSGGQTFGYPLTQNQIRTQVAAAIASGNRGQILTLASLLDGYNNLGCPINAAGVWQAN